jgi:hypothetical protein
MDVNILLSRLSGCRPMGRDRWQARCPSHDDKTPSMTIRAMDDGRLLIHCFAGCSALDIVESVGLSMTDLFPEPLGDFKPVRAPFSATDVLRTMKTEALVLAIAASDMADGKALAQVDVDRVALSAGRIADAVEYINAL